MQQAMRHESRAAGGTALCSQGQEAEEEAGGNVLLACRVPHHACTLLRMVATHMGARRASSGDVHSSYATVCSVVYTVLYIRDRFSPTARA